ncbi:MAG: M28 family peptidase, partial [Candidatus Aureabacteria bacterium]|nr:M28 family peptidase [Candidatus Auribacterota bacterium]
MNVTPPAAEVREYVKTAEAYLHTLCACAPHRRTGSAGNRAATGFFARTVKPWGYELDAAPFSCLDHRSGKASLKSGQSSFPVEIGPYSPGCDITAPLAAVSTVAELEKSSCRGKILLLTGQICAEPLMPKNFPFYNPDHHKKIYALLEAKNPAAVVTAPPKNPEMVGAIYPYPLIEDGDFDIPSVYCPAATGEEIAAFAGETFTLTIDARRIPATACNVIARKNPKARRKIVVSAHIDTREGTPGASDDASGTVVLLLLAEMLKDYSGPLGIEIVAFNGEDNYSAAGQKDYLRRFEKDLKTAVVAVNV